MRLFIMIFHLFLLFIPIIGHASACSTSCDTSGACKRLFFVGTKNINIYSNFPLDQLNSCVKEVIVRVHGNSRDAETQFLSMMSTAKSIGKQDSVLVIAPFFKTSSNSPASNEYYWTSAGWKDGDNSVNSGAQISSFTVLDELLNTIITNNMFPQLTHVTVAGHSAGGQYTQRYALSSPSPDQHTALPYQFLVMNPSSYAYLNNLRPNPTTNALFELPIYWNGSKWVMKPIYQAEAGSCPTTYNNYKYGLDKRNPYTNQFPTNQLISQYISRKVYYFLGALDTNPNDSELDTSCPGELEGPYRLKRGQNYYSFIQQYFPAPNHSIGIVPNVAHDANGMFNSDIVKAVLFT